MRCSKKFSKIISVFFLLIFLNSVFAPTVSFALTAGPAQPEFSSFEPVSNSNMVEMFSGDLTYNLPLLEVPGPNNSGYPLSLSYHSGVTSEEEASWVGYGWTLNAGAINRNTRGLPDDYKGKDVVFHNKMPKNWTATVGGGVAFGEVFGKDLKGLIGGSLNGSIRYNNYRGFGYNVGAGITLARGIVSMGYNVSDGAGSFSLNANPYAILNYTASATKKQMVGSVDRYLDKGFYKGFKERPRTSLGSSTNLIGSSYGIMSYTQVSKPNIVHKYSGQSYNVSVGLTVNPGPVPVGVSANTYGSYSWQKNEDSNSVFGFGYLYSNIPAGTAADKVLMDYHVENERDFNPRDQFLGVPFNDADQFIVSGEGLGGSFRLYNKTAGHFGPREIDSKIDILNVGAEMGTGWTFGPGVDVGKGESILAVKNWNKLSSFEDPFTSTQDEPVFFRFTGDLGGEWGDVHNDKPFQANIVGSNPALSPEQLTYNVGGKRSGRSSYIGYHLNKDMGSGTSPALSAYSKIKEVNDISDRTNPLRADLIGEIAVVNESGTQYNYGLPVYNRNEVNLSYSVRGLSVPSDNYLAYGNLNSEVKIGEEKAAQYASTYLLTEILGTDYNDRGKVQPLVGEYGASPDDVGGYTRFNYKNAFAVGATDWYDWRMPYTGLFYNRASMSDPLDDTGSYTEGEKEIYYLHSIETKTHVALFITSTSRPDGHEAPTNANLSSATVTGTPGLEKLDRIELYNISDFQVTAEGKLVREAWGSPKLLVSQPKAVKTVYFVYDNTLSPSLQNSTAGGKLTLKRVYTQYNGIENKNTSSDVRISPYEFSYTYPNYGFYPVDYRAGGLYDVSVNYAGLVTNATLQNPTWTKFSGDAWGFYQPNGATRFGQMRPWIDQNQRPNIDFDPAAYHLKRITLPSGGQIHIQYEQDDYSYVQDQQAHAMVTLKAAASPVNGTYLLDLASLGLTSTSPESDRIVAMLKDRYVGGGKKKLYFKLFYSLVGLGAPSSLSTCNADFITGYASVTAVSKTTEGIFITFDASQRLPNQVCEDFVKAQRLGKVLPNTSCDPNIGLSDGSDAKSVVLQLLNMAQNIAVPTLCTAYNPTFSALRVPIPTKKGGGVRVKRLMTHTMGLDGNWILYGSEYVYKTKDKNGNIISSGVATNEPQSIREENILVDFVARRGQTLGSKIVAGRDKDQSEGPIGESILPAPSVGYSKVVVKNIHGGKSNPGFSINEYYTAKDRPIILGDPNKSETMTAIKSTTPDRKNLTTPFYTEIRNKTLATQGFSFVLNNMHGQPMTVATYGGTYDINDETKSTEFSRTTYEYYNTNEKIPVMSSLFGGVTMKNPGREVDITYAQRKVTELQKDTNVEGDLQITIIPLLFIVLVIPYPTAIPAFSSIEGEMSTHATSKVVRYPAILKKVTTTQDGITNIQENIAFDENTGKPVAVRSRDEFKGAYLAQNIPASWEYKSMGGKWRSEGRKFTGTFDLQNGYLEIDGSCALSDFSVGDKIMIGSVSTSLYHVTDLDWVGNRLKVESVLGGSSAGASNGSITIVSSGRTNQLQAAAGAIAVHNETAANLTPVTVSQAGRYESNTFTSALNGFTSGLTSGSGNFTMPGPYNLMDVSAFAYKLPTCPVDLTQASIKNVIYRWSVVTVNQIPQLKLELMGFYVYCGPTPTDWVLVANEGVVQ